GPCLIRLNDQFGVSHTITTNTDDGSGAPTSPCHVFGPPVLEDVSNHNAEPSVLYQSHDEVCTEPSIQSDDDDGSRGSCGINKNSLGQDYVRHCQRLHSALLDALDLRRRDIAAMSDG